MRGTTLRFDTSLICYFTIQSLVDVGVSSKTRNWWGDSTSNGWFEEVLAWSCKRTP